MAAFDESLRKLGLDYLDLYLIHWPGKDKYKDTWRALEKLYKDGRVKAIGVSNFNVHHLESLLEDAEIKPMVNQVEFHPRLTQTELRDYCKKQGIQVEAWSPLMQGKLLDDQVLTDIAKNTTNPLLKSSCAGICKMKSSPFRSPSKNTALLKMPTFLILNYRRKMSKNQRS